MAVLSQQPKWLLFHSYFVKFVQEPLESSSVLKVSATSLDSRLVQPGLREIVDLFLDDGDLGVRHSRPAKANYEGLGCAELSTARTWSPHP